MRLGVHMVKLCHEKMRILRSILHPSKKNWTSSRKKLNLPPLENLEHPDKKLNSLGIISIPWKILKTSEKYQHSPSKKIPIYKKNVIQQPRKVSTIMKKPQPLHLKNFQLPWSNLKYSPHEKISIPPLQKQFKTLPEKSQTPWKILTPFLLPAKIA